MPLSYNYVAHHASLNIQDFINSTGISGITATYSYENKNTHEIRVNGVYEIGEYTVTATVNICHPAIK